MISETLPIALAMRSFERRLYTRYNAHVVHLNQQMIRCEEEVQKLVIMAKDIKEKCKGYQQQYNIMVNEIMTQISTRKEMKKAMRKERRLKRMRDTAAKNIKRKTIRAAMYGTRPKKCKKISIPLEGVPCEAHVKNQTDRTCSIGAELAMYGIEATKCSKTSMPPKPPPAEAQVKKGTAVSKEKTKKTKSAKISSITETQSVCAPQPAATEDITHNTSSSSTTSQPLSPAPSSSQTTSQPLSPKSSSSCSMSSVKSIGRLVTNMDPTYRPKLDEPEKPRSEYTWTRSANQKQKNTSKDKIARKMKESLDQVSRQRIRDSYALVRLDDRYNHDFTKMKNVGFLCLACKCKPEKRHRFKRKSEMIKHIRNVHAYPQRFECLVCETPFSQRAHCQRHIKNLHKD